MPLFGRHKRVGLFKLIRKRFYTATLFFISATVILTAALLIYGVHKESFDALRDITLSNPQVLFDSTSAHNLNNDIYTLKLIVYFSIFLQVLTAIITIAGAIYFNNSLIKASHMAYFDSLTELPNKTYLLEHLNDITSKGVSQTNSVALIIVEMDNFKKIKMAGEEICNSFLKSAADKFKKTFPHAEMICHLTPECFALILKSIYSNTMVEDEVEKIMKTFNGAWNIQEKEIYTTISVGISIFPADAQSSDLLISRAFTALYYSRETKVASYSFYEKYMNERSSDILEMKNALISAFSNNEFKIFYQPKVDYETGSIKGLEALLRWKHPEKGNIPPYIFIPIAEESGLMFQLGDWVIHECCRQIKSWEQQGISPPRVTVNLSSVQLNHPHISDRILSIINEYTVSPSLFGVSIGEHIIGSDIEMLCAELSKLRNAGLQIELDNFGVGYGSLNFLSTLPINVIKIDRSITNGINIDSFCEGIIQMLIPLSHAKNIKVIGCGIEHKVQLAYLTKNKCDLLQGYMISWPLPADEIEALLFLNKKYDFKDLSDVG